MTTWSPYQEKIFTWDKVNHLMIDAYAGCGKTTTIVELHKRLGSRDVLFMAFNKKNATDLSSRGVPASTMHSFGYRIVNRNLTGVKIADDNGRGKLKRISRNYNIDYKKVGLVIKIVDLLKAYLYPINGTTSQNVKDIAVDFALSDEPLQEAFALAVVEIFKDSLNDMYEIDFSDQICYPIYHSFDVPKYEYVIIDECQDLSPNKLELVSRAVGNRFVCVGDQRQAIYGFCGADSESMDKIKQQFDPQVYTLPITYRCGKRIVQEAHNHGVAPEGFAAGPNNAEGLVQSISMSEFLSHVQPKDFVLCRVTAPLVKYCFTLIKRGVRSQIVGKDVGERLINLLDKIDSECNHTVEGWCAAYTLFRQREITRLNQAEKEAQAEALGDCLDCLFVFTEGASSIMDMKIKIDRMFDDKINPEAVVFSTIHKAKGLEADRVYCLPYKSKTAKTEKQKQEEKNLLYVQITRAKHYLAWVQ